MSAADAEAYPSARQRIHDALIEAAAFQEPECVWVFHHYGERMSNRRFYEERDKACVEAGVYTVITDARGNVRRDKKGRPLLHRPIHFHDSRRTAVSMMGEMEVSDTDAQKVSGHMTRDMLMRYNQPRRDGGGPAQGAPR